MRKNLTIIFISIQISYFNCKELYITYIRILIQGIKELY